jgi:hypothetical protein
LSPHNQSLAPKGDILDICGGPIVAVGIGNAVGLGVLVGRGVLVGAGVAVALVGSGTGVIAVKSGIGVGSAIGLNTSSSKLLFGMRFLSH